MKDFTYHKVSEKEREQIKKDSKKLLDTFAKKLETIKAKESHFSNSSGTRQEGEGWNTDQDFHDLTLLNAPFVEDDFLVAEKGGWK